MTKLVNYEDSMYLIYIRINLIRDLLALDADPELFLNKTLDDIEFIDNSLELLLNGLSDNSQLGERANLLDHLSELEWQFFQAVSELLRDEKAFLPAESGIIREKLTIVRSQSHERRKKAESFEPAPSSGQNSLKPVVSSKELDELLRAL